MKPNFALSLSFEGISLLHRTDRGWYLVGEVSLDSDDMAGELQTLRKTAKALDNRGLTTKLILPNEQIRYIDVPTGKVSDAKRIEMAKAALDGATPYVVDDLAISASAHGKITHIAAVAHETLREAEAFANEHRFNPVCFVATPDKGGYLGEPFFGLATHAQTLSDGGAALGPEAQPARVVGKVKLPLPKRQPEPQLDSPPESQPELQDPSPEAGTTAPAPSAPDSATSTPPASTQADRTQADRTQADSAQADPVPDPPETPEPTPAPSFHSSRHGHDTGEDPTAPRLSGVSRLSIGETASNPTDTSPIAPESRGFHPIPQDEAAPSTPMTKRLTAALTSTLTPVLSSGRDLLQQVPKRLRKPAKTPSNDDLATPEPAEPAPEQPIVPDLTPPVAPDTGDLHTADLPPVDDSEIRRMTVFGERDDQAIGGKPRYLGLVLTVLLLLFLAAVATWASIFTDEGLAGLFRRATTEPAIATAPVTPAPTPTPAPSVAEETELAAISPVAEDEITDSAEAEAQATARPTQLTGRAAEARYAVTGIWLKAPEQPAISAPLTNDDLYIASIDSTISAQDAVLIPDTGLAHTDIQPRSLSAPAAPGTDFTYDERGFVVATRKGAETPEGITVFKGPPSVVPTSIPDRPDGPPEIDQIAERVALQRPRARPNNLLENSERARNGGLTLAELVRKRPKARPASAKFELEQNETPTQQAVAKSRKPLGRPKNFAETVELALAQKQEQAPDQQDGDLTRVAAVAPAIAATPRIPTTASVARQATVKNVINLRKVNLIGVYGTPASRRALVRLANGRYKKVKVGDRIDGGKVSAIGETELRYTKSGRNVVLKMPRT